jgi:hypothetical protein
MPEATVEGLVLPIRPSRPRFLLRFGQRSKYAPPLYAYIDLRKGPASCGPFSCWASLFPQGAPVAADACSSLSVSSNRSGTFGQGTSGYMPPAVRSPAYPPCHISITLEKSPPRAGSFHAWADPGHLYSSPLSIAAVRLGRGPLPPGQDVGSGPYYSRSPATSKVFSQEK